MSITPQVRETVLARDNLACARCGCSIYLHGYSIHHRRPRGMGGSKRPETDLPANLLTLCGSGTTGCHGWVERNRGDALSAGFLLRQNQDPEEVPVQTIRGRVLLTNDGHADDVGHCPTCGTDPLESECPDTCPRMRGDCYCGEPLCGHCMRRPFYA